MTIKMKNEAVAQQMAKAFESGSQDEIAGAWAAFGADIAEQVREDFKASEKAADEVVLASRGYRQLTAKETKFYEGLAGALKSRSPKQAFVDIIGNDDAAGVMPETVIEDVVKYLQTEHPLLSAINVQYTGYSAKWIINDNTVQSGAWGDVTESITAEIKGALKVLNMEQSRYSGFCVIPLDILDMGPSFLDAFIRATLAEAMSLGLEDAVINGSGVNMPTGMVRNPNGNFNQSTGYPKKSAVAVTSFEPAEYGALVANLAKTEKGKERRFSEVTLICSMTDYLTKVMPATTVLASNGAGYAHDLFPFATNVIVSSAVESGKAVLGIVDDYTLAVGGERNGAIEYDDSVGFLDYTRTFRVVQHADGRAYDNTSFQVLDISKLDPAYITVKNVASAASGD